MLRRLVRDPLRTRSPRDRPSSAPIRNDRRGRVCPVATRDSRSGRGLRRAGTFLQAGGHWFDPCTAHFTKPLEIDGFVHRWALQLKVGLTGLGLERPGQMPPRDVSFRVPLALVADVNVPDPLILPSEDLPPLKEKRPLAGILTGEDATQCAGATIDRPRVPPQSTFTLVKKSVRHAAALQAGRRGPWARRGTRVKLSDLCSARRSTMPSPASGPSASATATARFSSTTGEAVRRASSP